jgi:hypothetical protein
MSGTRTPSIVLPRSADPLGGSTTSRSHAARPGSSSNANAPSRPVVVDRVPNAGSWSVTVAPTTNFAWMPQTVPLRRRAPARGSPSRLNTHSVQGASTGERGTPNVAGRNPGACAAITMSGAPRSE